MTHNDTDLFEMVFLGMMTTTLFAFVVLVFTFLGSDLWFYIRDRHIQTTCPQAASKALYIPDEGDGETVCVPVEVHEEVARYQEESDG